MNIEEVICDWFTYQLKRVHKRFVPGLAASTYTTDDTGESLTIRDFERAVRATREPEQDDLRAHSSQEIIEEQIRRYSSGMNLGQSIMGSQ